MDVVTNGSTTIQALLIATQMNVTTTVDPDAEILNIPRTSLACVLFLVILTLVTVAANLSIIISFIVEPRLREPFGYYLLNLACSDLITGGWSMPHLVVYTYYNYWPYGYNHCSLWLYVDWLGVNAQLATFAAISTDRLWAACWPINYRHYNTAKKAKIVIAITWLFVNAGLMPGLIYDRVNNQTSYGKYDCHWDFNGPAVWATPLYVVPVTEWIPVIVTTVCYAITATKIFQAKHRRQRQTQTATNRQATDADAVVLGGAKARRMSRERQAFILLSLLFAALVTCWAPWFVYSGMSTYRGFFDANMFIVTYWIGYSLATINPVLFNIANKEVRTTVRRILKCTKTERVNPGVWSITNRQALPLEQKS